MKPSTGTYSLLLAPVTAATTVRTANLDTADANYASIEVVLGAEANTNSTNVAIQLSESDDTVVTNFATFDANFNRTVDNTAGTMAVSHVDLDGRKRYIKVTVTPDATTNGAVLSSVSAVLHKTVMSGDVADYGDDVVVG